jgi:hypothetical protein
MKKKSLFDDAVSQCIDSNGKCRIVNYKDISVSTVLPVLNVKPVPVDLNIKGGVKLATVTTVKKFAKARNLTLVRQQGDSVSQTVMGIWAKSKEFPLLPPIYIPVSFEENIPNADPDIPFSDESIVDPIFTGETSVLEKMRHNAKIAEYLKQYAIYEWSQNPNGFGKNNFVIIKDHSYEPINNHFFTYNNVFFKLDLKSKTTKPKKKEISKKSKVAKRYKIIVPDEETQNRLLTFVQTSSLNDSMLAEKYKNKKLIDGKYIYKNINDFRSSENQLIFMGADAVLRWKREKEETETRSNILNHPRPSLKSAYYYRNYRIENGRLAIVQNTVFADFPAALAVSSMWERYGINPGYNPKPGTIDVPNDPAYRIYTNEGLAAESKIKPNEKDDILGLYVFNYDDGSFAALLFL